MLHGERITLRARAEADVPVLHAELYNDVAVRGRADTRAWLPRPATESPFAVAAGITDAAFFSVVDDHDDLAGACELWGIDGQQRSAHIGIVLRPSWRGQGLAAEAIAVLCRYAFNTLGLHRLGCETLADNIPMIKAAQKNGFTEEGRLHEAHFADGTWHDQTILGLLTHQWRSTSAES